MCHLFIIEHIACFAVDPLTLFAVIQRIVKRLRVEREIGYQKIVAVGEPPLDRLKFEPVDIACVVSNPELLRILFFMSAVYILRAVFIYFYRTVFFVVISYIRPAHVFTALLRARLIRAAGVRIIIHSNTVELFVELLDQVLILDLGLRV